MLDLPEIMKNLSPNNNWKIIANNLIWKDDISLKPTEIEIEAKRIELQNALPMKVLRRERYEKLKNCDVYGLNDFPFSTEEIKQSWLDYRQALRNLPSNSSPQLDDNGELINVNWPIPPS
jgi:hypothetical protein